MNARQKAKKYKQLLEKERRKVIKPTVVYEKHDIKHFAAESLITNDLLENDLDMGIALKYATKRNIEKLMETVIRCALISIDNNPYLDAKVVRHDLWVVDRGGAE